MIKNFHFAMQLSFTLNLNLNLVKTTYDMLNIIFKKCFLVNVRQEKLLNFVDLKQIFELVLILNIFPNMHQIALQSIYVSNILRRSMPLASSGVRPSISSLMEKLILVETSHQNCWIHPCLTNQHKPKSTSQAVFSLLVPPSRQ